MQRENLVNNFKVNLALAFTLFFWASAFVGIRIGLVSYTPGSLALLRFLVASFCMLLIYSYVPNKPPIPWSHRLELMLLGVAGIGVYNICLNIGETTVSAGVASFVIGMIPVVTIVLSALFLKERLTTLAWSGVIISVFGLLIMVLGENAPIELGSGVLVIFISSLMGGLYTVLQKRYLIHYHPVMVTAWVMWGGSLLLLWFANDLLHQIMIASFASTTSAIYMGIFPAALAYVAWSYVLHHLSASTASMYIYFLPILSTLLGMLLLNEHPSVISLFGGILSLAGALIATRLDQWSNFLTKNSQC